MSKSTVTTATRAVGKSAKRADVSRQDGPQDDGMGSVAGEVIATPYPMAALNDVFEKSNVLRQCVESMVINIAKFGIRSAEVSKKVEIASKEQDLLDSFISSANIDESLSTVIAKHVFDYEKYGFGFFEVIRSANGKVSALRHIKAFNTRLCSKSGDAIEVKRKITRGGSTAIIREYKKFRRYVQITNGRKVYFKEMGDPRRLHYLTGLYETQEYKVKDEDLATEVIHRRQYSEDAYGTPRWIAQLPNILGSREAEEVNLRYFEDNTVPPMVMMVNGGKLTRQSFNNLNKMLTSENVGKDRQNQILLIEAIAEGGGLDDGGAVDIKLEKLTDARQSDALFSDYDQSNIAKVRSTFRLPPVFLGMSQDVTFATANVSAYLAETQVFAPERADLDEFLNKRLILNPDGMGLTTCRIESKGPSVTNPEQVTKTLTALNAMGGVTPRTSIDMVNEYMQLSLPQYPEKDQEGYEEWMDIPYLLGQRMFAGTQQTGEGENTHDNANNTDNKVAETEDTGVTEPEGVENGQQ